MSDDPAASHLAPHDAEIPHWKTRIAALKESCRLTSVRRFQIHLGGWQLVLSIKGTTWRAGLQIFPVGRSSVDADWEIMGILVALLGAPMEAPEKAIETCDPNEIHWFRWEDTDTIRPREKSVAPGTVPDPIPTVVEPDAGEEDTSDAPTGDPVDPDADDLGDWPTPEDLVRIRALRVRQEGATPSDKPGTEIPAPENVVKTLDLSGGIGIIYDADPVVPGAAERIRHLSVSRIRGTRGTPTARKVLVPDRVLTALMALFDLTGQPMRVKDGAVHFTSIERLPVATDAAPVDPDPVGNVDGARWVQRRNGVKPEWCIVEARLPVTTPALAPEGRFTGAEGIERLVWAAQHWEALQADGEPSAGKLGIPRSIRRAAPLDYRFVRKADGKGWVLISFQYHDGGQCPPDRYDGAAAIDRMTRFASTFLRGLRHMLAQHS